MGETRKLLIRGLLPAALAAAASQLVLLAATGWPTTTGAFWGPDSYMRLARTLACRGGPGCSEGLFPGTNAPLGEVLHWPFLQDWIFLGSAAPLVPFFGWDRAILLAAPLLGPLLLILSAAILLLAARPLVSGPGRYFVGLLLVFQPWVFQAFALPTLDHHALQGFLFLTATAGMIQLIGNPKAYRWAGVTGIALGLSYWVSTEALVSGLPILLGMAFVWLVRGGREGARTNGAVILAAVGVLTIGLLVDGPPGERLAPVFDRFSIVHWILLALIALFWMVAARLPERWVEGIHGRLLSGLGGLTVIAGSMRLLYPDFFGGPMVEMNPELASVWLRYTSEFVPVASGTPLSVKALHLTSALLAIPLALLYAASGDRQRHDRWTFLVCAALWFAGLTLFLHGRWALYLHLLVPIPLGALIGRTVEWAKNLSSGLARVTVNVGSVALVALAPLLLAASLAAAESGQDTPVTVRTDCRASRLVPFLGSLEQDRGPGIVLAPADWGPEIVFRTAHRAVASPYHRNAEGLLDSRAFMAATDPSTSRRIADRRGIDWVIVCLGHDWFPRLGLRNASILYSRLSSSRQPTWLRRVTLPDSLSGSFAIYEVDESKIDTAQRK